MSEVNIMAGLGIAVREYQLTTGEADYGLYVDGKVAGVIEAKKEGSTLTGVETQTDKYAKGLPDGVPHYGLPLPFGYESTGVVGMCKQDKNKSKQLDRQPTVSLERAFPTKKEVSKGVVHPDLASTLGAKISRLAGNRSEAWHTDVEKQTSGQPVSKLISTLFDSVDADKNRDLAASKLGVSAEEVTDAQLDEIEAEQVKAALFPFHNAKLREILLRLEHQVIDKFTRDQLLTSSFDPEAKQRAETLVTSFRQFIEDNKAEIEAIEILYSRPYAAGLRYSQVKELGAACRSNRFISTSPSRKLCCDFGKRSARSHRTKSKPAEASTANTSSISSLWSVTRSTPRRLCDRSAKRSRSDLPSGYRISSSRAASLPKSRCNGWSRSRTT